MLSEFNFKAASERILPQNIEAEELILGGILLDPEAINRVTEILRPEMFSITAHQQIYKAAIELHSKGMPTDLMSVTTWLSDRSLLSTVGGQSKLAQLVARTVSTVNIDLYAKLIVDKYLRRTLIQAGNQVADLGYDTATELPLIMERAEQIIFNVTQSRPQQGLIPISDTLIQTFQDIQNRNQGAVMPGLTCGFYDLDAMTGGFQRSDLIVIAGRPSMGKCLTADSIILQADGSLSTIAEIYNQRQANLLTLGQDWKFHITQPSEFIDDGIKPVFRVTTQLGRVLESTITHPYLTVEGWQPLEKLKPGDKIAVPRRLEVFGKATIRECEVDLLAYLIGNGCLTGELPQFTNSNSKVIEEFKQAIADFSPELIVKIETQKERAAILYTVTQKNNNKKNPLIEWLQYIGIWGKKDTEKIIPAFLFKLKRSLISRFLNRLFVTTGYSLIEKLKIGYITVSKNLAQQLQHLLLRFGIISRIDKQKNIDLWYLDITAESIKDFIIEISRQQIEIKNVLENIEKLPLQQLTTSDIYWDEIAYIEAVGCKQVYDLTIPGTHNFIANDICVHNTAISVSIARNIAMTHKQPVAIFSLEMSKEQLVQRLLAGEAGIESNRLRSGRISQNEWEQLSRAIGILSELPIFIDDTSNITVTEIRSQSRRLMAEQGGTLGLILIDYLQLMEGSNADNNRVQELSRITRGLKGLARELNVPVIALSQLSRGVETRTNKRPMLSDLRESGSIEQDADIVIMLYRDEYYSPDTPDRGIAEIIIAKHRNGPTGTVKLLFDPQFTRFRNMAMPNRL
ncbi:MAG: replicative DNA helicase [Oscillatoriaceae bacterium SKW80]|nr:replicative DNA helicase [Oscillatoriaceae bacterium SKYG93]MCX8122474.1 replicative DNA helicase [Oscillatoriaceae bacterium SKW80]MDW8452576.1 replicative DNA helicase [Oscillatoriaceae cyanobacterium SKYGB_i_bin93]HIK27349.1 replicative DNA helicase [Oscillatoriaceae cyanobacterium M7585_C2015_266]